jgi:hypothetical protein
MQKIRELKLLNFFFKNKYFYRNAGKNVNCLLVGNKCDLEKERKITYEAGFELGKL